MKNSPFLLPGFGNLLSFGKSPGFHRVFTRFWNFTKFNPNFSVKHINFTPKNGKTRPGEFRLTEGLPGIHQRFIAIGFPGNGAEETLLSKLPTITAVKPWCNPETSWSPRLGETSENLVKTWWKQFPKLGEKLKKILVNFQYLVNFQNLVKTWLVQKVFTKRTTAQRSVLHLQNSPKNVFFFFLRFTVMFGLNLVKFQNLVKTCWRPGEFPKPPWLISGTWCYETFW